ncbi:MAG: DUF4065 domain-containing protein [Asticcacaulis sp.]|uniref:Panacea domain-containing protein n=1 Tax=Asticcacaulis sp. TaxID=1872648 RepID=UPI0039E5B58C
MPKPYHSTTVAQEILNIANSSGVHLTPMQLVKLTYIAHGFSLALDNAPLISDRIEAWKYGPVIPPLYKAVKRYGNGIIQGPIDNALWTRSESVEGEDRQLIKEVFDKYGKLSGIQLSYLTHRTGTPWQRTFRPDGWSDGISNDLIKEHYKDILEAVHN